MSRMDFDAFDSIIDSTLHEYGVQGDLSYLTRQKVDKPTEPSAAEMRGEKLENAGAFLAKLDLELTITD